MWYIIDKTNEEVTTMRKELLKGLSEEQIKKVEACKSPEEIIELAKAEGIELTDEQLEAISGGCARRKIPNCPVCGSSNVHMNLLEGNTKDYFTCRVCDHQWYA